MEEQTKTTTLPLDPEKISSTEALQIANDLNVSLDFFIW